jgi:hypothetical protein
MPGNTGVMSGVLGIPVAQIVLRGPQVGALVGKVIAAGMAQHVRPDAAERCALASSPRDIIDGLAGERSAAPAARTRTARAGCPPGVAR